MKLRRKILLLFTMCFVILVCFFLANSNNNINAVLKSNAYSYLPESGKKFITEYYEKTGIILDTEKNKEINVPYLNPAYVVYLENGPDEFGLIPTQTIVDYPYANVQTIDNLPVKYNLRDFTGNQKVLTRVEDQKSNGLCWAYSFTTAMESYLLKHNFVQGEYNLSITQTDYATAYPKFTIDTEYNPYFGHYNGEEVEYQYQLRNGGNHYRFFSSAIYGVNPVGQDKWDYSENGVPYEENGTYSAKRKPIEVWNFDNSPYEVNGLTYFPSPASETDKANYRNLIKQSIIENGAVVTNIYWNWNNVIGYNSSNSLNSHGVDFIFYNSENRANHAVTVIGWDDNYQKNICVNSQTNTVKIKTGSSCEAGYVSKIVNGAWIIQNSWGEGYNNNSPISTYFYLAYDSNYEDFVAINDVSTRRWDNAYNRFTATHNKIGNNQNELVINTHKAGEKLNKLKFYSPINDITASIYIKNGNSNYELFKTTQVTYAGLYTVDLSNYNQTMQENFSVKIVFSSSIMGINDTNQYYFSVYTDNLDEEIFLDTNKVAKYTTANVNPYNNSNKNYLFIDGVSKNLVSGKEIDVRITDSNNNDLTNLNIFDVNRNYSVSNIINMVINYNKNMSLDRTYYFTYFVDGKEYGKSAFFQGNGTKANPYLIYSISDFDFFEEGKYYKLASDIIVPNDYEPISVNIGGLDGDNHKISGANINKPNEENVGLFKELTALEITNLVISDSTFIGLNSVGALSGILNNVNNINNVAILNCHIESKNNNSYAAGITGKLNSDQSYINIQNIYVNNDVKGSFASGLIGMASNNINYQNIYISGRLIGTLKSTGVVSSQTLVNNLSVNNIVNIAKQEGTNIEPVGFSNNSYNLNISGLINKNTTFSSLKNESTYSSWPDFNAYFELPLFDSIKRFPILKNAVNSMTYTTLKKESIVINDSTISASTLVSPNTNVSYEVLDSSIVKIDENGFLVPIKKGQTTINVKSYYDGYEASINVNSNISNTYVVTIHDNDKEYIYYYEESQTFKPMDLISYFEKDFDKYNFIGLNTQNSLDATTYGVNDVVEVNDNMDLYIMWEIKKYDVVIYSNYNEDNITETKDYGNQLTLSSDLFTKEGYEIISYNTKSDGSGESYNVGDTININSNITLYAIWEIKKYDVVIYSNYNDDNIAESKDYGNQLTLSSDLFTKEGYEIISYNTKSDGSGESYNLGDTININSNITLYAIWRVIYTFETPFIKNSEYLENVTENMSVNYYKSKININGATYKIYDHLGNPLKDNALVGTGARLEIQKESEVISYINIIKGDNNGDGLIGALDYIRIKNHIMNTSKINENYFLKAADYDNDEKITALDYIKIKNYIMNKKEL